jgi:hypothetical protein
MNLTDARAVVVLRSLVLSLLRVLCEEYVTGMKAAGGDVVP